MGLIEERSCPWFIRLSQSVFQVQCGYTNLPCRAVRITHLDTRNGDVGIFQKRKPPPPPTFRAPQLGGGGGGPHGKML